MLNIQHIFSFLCVCVAFYYSVICIAWHTQRDHFLCCRQVMSNIVSRLLSIVSISLSCLGYIFDIHGHIFKELCTNVHLCFVSCSYPRSVCSRFVNMHWRTLKYLNTDVHLSLRTCCINFIPMVFQL